MKIPMLGRYLFAASALAVLIAVYLMSAAAGWVALGMLAVVVGARHRRASAAPQAEVAKGAF